MARFSGCYMSRWSPSMAQKGIAQPVEIDIAKSHGFAFSTDDKWFNDSSHDVYVVMGERSPGASFCRARGKPVFYVTDGVFNCDKKYGPSYPYCVGLNGPYAHSEEYLNREANLCKRRSIVSYQVEDWKIPAPNDYILYAHQSVPKITGGNRIAEQQQLMDHVLRQSNGRRVVLRKHPGHGSRRHFNVLPQGIYEISENASLADDLQKACCLVTHQSSAAVQAVFAGVSVYLSGLGLASPMSPEDFSACCLYQPNREKWIDWLTYRHWKFDEIFPMVRRWHENEYRNQKNNNV